MSEPLRPMPITRRPKEAEDRLDSWKEIAAYLGREVRTVQGWEKAEGLPVHRHVHGRLGSVYAFRSELDSWRAARTEAPAESPAPTVGALRSGSVWKAALGGVLALLLAAGLMLWKKPWQAAGDTPSSVVVLPFLDLSPAKNQDYFSDGLTEEIIDALSRVPNLRVVARTSAFAFKGKAVDIRQIGRQLSVNAVLEGSVRQEGDRLRITAQLNRVSDGTHLWSRTYDRQLRDVFAVQRDISQAIAAQLRAGTVPHREPTTDLEAYRLYQEGRYLFNQHQIPDSYWKAIERYQQAIKRDPRFALAYAGMSDAYSYLAESFAIAPKEVAPKAKEAAEHALALDPNLGEAHTSMGIVKLDDDWDRQGGEEEMRKAMQLIPGSGYARHWHAHSLEAQGRVEDALQEMRAALALDPLSLPISWDIGMELLALNRPGEALRHNERALELFPRHPILLYVKTVADLEMGNLPAAHATVDILKSDPAQTDFVPIRALIGEVAAREGRTAEARGILAQLEQERKTRYVDGFMVTALAAALQDRQQLLTWVQRAYEERSTQWVYARLHPELRDTRDPELAALLARTQ